MYLIFGLASAEKSVLASFEYRPFYTLFSFSLPFESALVVMVVVTTTSGTMHVSKNKGQLYHCVPYSKDCVHISGLSHHRGTTHSKIKLDLRWMPL